MDRMYFIGVSTKRSSIMGIFPKWVAALGLDAEIVGVDVTPGAPPDALRDVVENVVADDNAVGALVTTHKLAVYEGSSDLFDTVDAWCALCGEVSCLAKREGRLLGWAKDPITSWASFADVAGADHFARYPEAEVLCLGAGGSGTAFATRLLTVDHPPARIVISDRSPGRLDAVERIHLQVDTPVSVSYRPVVDPSDNDHLLSRLPSHSVVVNATGMGKDLPGTPIGDDVAFPEHGVAWDFNYRGSLQFIAQARAQADRQLTVADGWGYFLRGWADHIAEIFQIEITMDQRGNLALIADAVRRHVGPD